MTHASDLLNNTIIPKRGGKPDEYLWSAWMPPETAEMVRAMVKDFLDEFGDGHDWQAAGDQANLVMAGMCSDILDARNRFFRDNPGSGDPKSKFEFRLRLEWPGKPETFDVLVESAMDAGITPMPLPGTDRKFVPERQSVSRYSTAMVPSKFDATGINNEGILQALDQVVAQFTNKDYYTLMLVVCSIVRWKATQVSRYVQGGSVHRNMKNTAMPDRQPYDMRVLFARGGAHVDQAFTDGGSHSSVLILA